MGFERLTYGLAGALPGLSAAGHVLVQIPTNNCPVLQRCCATDSLCSDEGIPESCSPTGPNLLDCQCCHLDTFNRNVCCDPIAASGGCDDRCVVS